MNSVSTGDGGKAVQVLQKIDNMINGNMLILGVFLLLLIALGLSLYYFVSSLIQTVTIHNTNKLEIRSKLKGGNSIKDTTADNEIYLEPGDKDDIEVDLAPAIDPKKFMPRGKREFISQLKLDNLDYNKKKTEILVNDLNYTENDDLVDDKILFPDYDNYEYGNKDDE